MANFLRQNWIWIAAPIAVALALVALFWWLSDNPGASPIQYQSL